MALSTPFSPRRVKASEGLPIKSDEDLIALIQPFAHKFMWFAQNGYKPHVYQILFHANHYDNKLRRYRALVAGRRGGKTLSAAWEVVYYCHHPEQFHLDYRGTVSSEPLHGWVLIPDYSSSGRAALFTLRKVLRESGLIEGTDYKENRSDMIIEFSNGSIIEFKTAERPDKLVGMGLDFMWVDEGAAIPTQDAWNYARPALSDKIGMVMATTTPRQKNWLYQIFWGPDAVASQKVGTVEYWSIHNPYFSEEEWLEARRTYPPLMFKQEFQASFDSMAGKDLSGEWLKYFTFEKETEDDNVLVIPRRGDGNKYALTTYMGVDPAISLSDDADRFAISLIGVTEDRSTVFLLKTWAGKIPFHEQLEKLADWHRKFRPSAIGVENTAFQRVLADQLARMDGMPNVLGIPADGKKVERIMGMSPLFASGRVRIHPSQRDFIEEWIDYDSSKRNTNDDLLDAVEISLRTAGILLPDAPDVSEFGQTGPESFEDWVHRNRAARRRGKGRAFDPDMGVEY
jgi:predicted phage terminase large subunit-like protein